jgi:hypothetical protein
MPLNHDSYESSNHIIEITRVVNLSLEICTRGVDFMYHVMNFLNTS